MTDHPYTDDDLRAEAARQHAGLTKDPDYVGVGEQMEDRHIQSTVIAEDPDFAPEGVTWAGALDPEGDGTAAYDEAQRKIHDLITGAADVSEWAVNLGADGMEPDERALDAGEHSVRVHFAFAPGISDADRADLIGQFAAFMTAGLT